MLDHLRRGAGAPGHTGSRGENPDLGKGEDADMGGKIELMKWAMQSGGRSKKISQEETSLTTLAGSENVWIPQDRFKRLAV